MHIQSAGNVVVRGLTKGVGMGLEKYILVVEDEEILAENLKAYLERRGCTVRVALDGASAIALAGEFKPEFVVLDYRLPDMDGFSVLDSIRSRQDCACVLTTGHPTSEVLSAAASRGIEHILFKPYPMAELASALLGEGADGARAAAQRGSTARALSGGAHEERRQAKPDGFPMRLFDGTWVLHDRREPESPEHFGKTKAGKV